MNAYCCNNDHAAQAVNEVITGDGKHRRLIRRSSETSIQRYPHKKDALGSDNSLQWLCKRHLLRAHINTKKSYSQQRDIEATSSTSV